MLLGHSFKANLAPRIHANYKSHHSIPSCSKIRGFPFNFLFICFWGIGLKLISHPEYIYKSHRSIRSCSRIRGFPFNFLLICFWGIRLKLISHPEYMQITNLIAQSGHVAKFGDFLSTVCKLQISSLNPVM